VTLYDLICIGAGPTGLACAIEAKRAGLRPLVIDKGCLCNSLYHYPTNMVFFTTSERMEIGDLPMTTLGGKPTRAEALKYYRRAVEHYNIEIKLYEMVNHVDSLSVHFCVHTRSIHEPGESADGDHSCAEPRSHVYHGRKIVIATGYYDLPNYLGVPGEDLPCVSHYFTDPHPYWNQDVVVVGARNSAAEAALELFRGGARVTLVHRGAELGKSLKYWIKPDIENRIRAGEIKALFNYSVTRFEPGRVYVQPSRGGSSAGSSALAITYGEASEIEKVLPAAHAFVMTGYHPDFSFLEKQGIRLDPVTMRPEVNPETLETNVPGIFVAGVVVGGKKTSDIFIENGRFHGRQIIAAITGKGRIEEPAPVAPPGE